MISRSAKTNVGWMSFALVHMRELRLRERDVTRMKLQNHCENPGLTDSKAHVDHLHI